MQRIAKTIVNHPKLIAAILLAATVALSAVAARLKFDDSVEAILAHDPKLSFYEEVKREFGSDEFVVIGLETQDVFDFDDLRLIDRVTRELEALENVDRVISLTNVNKIRGTEEGFEVSPLMRAFPQNRKEIETLKREALSTSLYEGNLVAKDGRAAAIIAIIQDVPGDERYRSVLVGQIQEIVEGCRERGRNLYVAGVPVLKSYLVAYMRRDLNVFLPLLFLMMSLIAFLIFHNLRGVILPLVAILISLIWTLAFFVSQGRLMNNVTSMIPPLVLSYVVTYSLHIINCYYEEASSLADRKEIVGRALGKVALPCLMSCLTTAIGMSSLGVSRIIPIRDFGLFGAAGVVLGFVLSLTLVPILLLFWKVHRGASPQPPRKGSLEKALGRIVGFAGRRSWAVLAVWIGIFLLSLHGIFQLQVETNPLSFFKKNSDFPLSTRFVEEHLGGASSLEVVFRGPGADSIIEPKALKAIEGLQNFAETLPRVNKTVSLNDFLKEMNQAMDGGSPGSYRVPSSQALAAQYLLLYSMSGEGDDLEDYVNYDRSSARLTIRMSENSSAEVLKLIRKIEAFSARNLDPPVQAEVTGHSVVLANMLESLVRGQLHSLALAILIISGMMALVFRSLTVGLLSIVPNLIPISLTLGVMGWWGVPLDQATSIIACVALGMIVDDTIYLTHRFKKELAVDGDYVRAMDRALVTTGRAVIHTSLILTGCFGILMFSHFIPIIYFGALTSFTMLTALAADLSLTPALLIAFRPKFLTAPFSS